MDKCTNYQLAPLGTVCVLDLETAPDPLALALTRRKAVNEMSGPLFRIVSASVLFASELAHDEWSSISIRSEHDFDASPGGEERVLEKIDSWLQDVVQCDGLLITYNGVRFDLPMIARRGARHLMFHLNGVMRDPPIRHHDLMFAGGRSVATKWHSLRHAAAGLGIPVHCQIEERGIGVANKAVRKGEADVVATFLLFLYELAMRRGSPAPVVTGWRALGDHIRQMGPHGEHLAQYRRHQLGMQVT